MKIKVMVIGMLLAYFITAGPLFAVYYIVSCRDEIKMKELALKELEKCADQVNKDVVLPSSTSGVLPTMPCAMQFQTLLWSAQRLNYCRYKAELH